MARTLWPARIAVLLITSWGCASAPRLSDPDSVKAYLDGGGPVDRRFDDGDCRGCTLLHRAAERGQLTMMRRLLDRGADPNALDARRMTPLHHVARGLQSAKAAMLLVSRGANLSLPWRDSQGLTPLLAAVGSVAEVHALRIGPQGVHLGIERAVEPSAELIEALLSAGADLKERDKKGNAPLHVAASLGYSRTVALLLKAGASRYARNGDGETAEELARRLGQKSVTDLFWTPARRR
jgi:uncharacterized protein